MISEEYIIDDIKYSVNKYDTVNLGYIDYHNTFDDNTYTLIQFNFYSREINENILDKTDIITNLSFDVNLVLNNFYDCAVYAHAYKNNMSPSQMKRQLSIKKIIN
jgi:hypothetical protein